MRPRPTPGSDGQVPRPLDVSRPFSGMERLEKRKSAPKTQGGTVACAPTTLRPAPWLSPRERLGARERRAAPRPAGPQQRARDRVSSIGQQERPPRARGGNSVQSEHGHWRGQAKRRMDRRVGAELPVGSWSLRGATEAEVGSEAAVGSGGQRLGLSLHAQPRPPRPAPPHPAAAASASPSKPPSPGPALRGMRRVPFPCRPAVTVLPRGLGGQASPEIRAREAP